MGIFKGESLVGKPVETPFDEAAALFAEGFRAAQKVDEPACRLDLPVPPSTNNLFVNRQPGQGRARGPSYRAWLKEAGWEIVQQSLWSAQPTLQCRVRVHIDAQLRPNRDIDNVLKPILDLLVKMSVIADDSLVDELTIVRRKGEGGRCGVAIWPV